MWAPRRPPVNAHFPVTTASLPCSPQTRTLGCPELVRCVPTDPIAREPELPPLRYISTRGEAPALSFDDALLAGLARDGGLYMPETWPKLTPETIAAFAGRPFAEVAVALLEAFAGGSLPRNELIDIARSAYARFGHPAVTPLVQIDRSLWVLELFHGPTLAFKDVAMQLLSRLMDRVLSARGQRVTIVAATSGDTGGAAIEAYRGSERVDAIVLFPHGRVSDVQRRMMTTASEPNVHAVAIEGTFDDCQALVKAMFNDLAFRDRLHLAAVNSINWGRIVAQLTYYFVAGAALGSPSRSVAFAVPTGNFGDIFAGYCAKMMGLPAERLVIATNENDILARAWSTGLYTLADVVATTSPSMDIQVSSNFERFLFEASGRDAAFVRARMEGLRQSRSFGLGEAMVPFREAFLAERVDQAAVADCIRRVKAESGYLLDPHSACAVVAARKTQDSAIGARASHRAGHGPSGQVPGRHGGHRWRAAGVAAEACHAHDGQGTHHGAAQRPCHSSALRRRARTSYVRSRSMTTEMTRLANGMRVVTHHMSHVETVSLGVWVAAGARHEAVGQHGISHLLEHMAFKGTKRRTASDIAEEIEAVGGELNAATSLETTAYYARVLKGDVGLALDILADILQIPRYAEDELEREREVILQEIAATRDSPDELAYELLQEAAYPEQPVGRPILGTTASVKSFSADDLRAFLGQHYVAGRMVLSAAGNLDHGSIVRHAEALFGSMNGGSEGRFEAARYVGGTRASPKPFEQSHLVMGFVGPSYRNVDYYTAQVFSGLFGGGMSSRLFQEVRERRGLCYAIYSSVWSLADTGLFGIHAATGQDAMGKLIEVVGEQLARAAGDKPGESELARAKAQLKAGLLMGLESSGARAEQMARQLLLFNRLVETAELVERVEGVSAEATQAFAQGLLTEAAASVAVVGAGRNGESYATMAGQLAGV